ncbi:uncharacterized protein LOC142559375 [Dermacentor variabilis]|uniref:uncharacterized protein LOC142559375 n=1 Tax=Dermacentor variabilis TaxID=34621 RepID=UPI003F5BFA36
MEHALLSRWNAHLEQKGAYPPSIIRFRPYLSTQDAMIQLKYQVLDGKTRGTRAILSRDLESAFDVIAPSGNLHQITRQNLGARMYNYVKDFLKDRRDVLVAEDLELEEQVLVSIDTPQGSFISPTLFNLVMIGLAEKLQELKDVRHTIYVDYITIWVHKSSDGYIGTTLQLALHTIEERLVGTGLRC